MKPAATEQKILRLKISDVAVLNACYMPFLRHKGLFVPSLKARQLGEKVFLILRLEQQNLTVAGLANVCWITPEYSSDGREPGYGLHFAEEAEEMRAAVASAAAPDGDGGQAAVRYTP